MGSGLLFVFASTRVCMLWLELDAFHTETQTKRNETKKNSTEVELDGWAVAGVKASRADG